MNELIIPRLITRKFVKANLNIIFLYGHDLLRKGCLGQAWEMFDEPNTFFIPTMYKYCANQKFFQDCNADEWIPKIDEAISKIPKDGRPIIPLRKIGEGCARLQEFGPRILKHIKQRIKSIETPHIINWYDT